MHLQKCLTFGVHITVRKCFFLFFFADYFGNHYSARAVMTTSNEVFIHDTPLRNGIKYNTSDEA